LTELDLQTLTRLKVVGPSLKEKRNDQHVSAECQEFDSHFVKVIAVC